MRIALLILPCLLCAEECNEDVALLQALQPGKPTETLNVTTPDPHDAQSVMGVRGNSVGDEKAFLSGLTTNVLMIVGVAFAFGMLRRFYPLVYSYNSLSELIPERVRPTETLCGWLWVGSKAETDDALIEAVGLDSVLMLDFISLCIQILMRVGVVGCCVLTPLHLFFGWGGPDVPSLSRLGMSNVIISHPWLYYVHGLFVAYVCWVVKSAVYTAQEGFLERRFKWLKRLPHPRSRTVMVEGIPEAFKSDEKVREFFGKALSLDVVEEVHLVKKTKHLEYLVSVRQKLADAKQQAEFQFEKEGERPTHHHVEVGKVPKKVDSIEFYAEEVKDTENSISEEYNKIMSAEGTANCDNAFVTFKTRKACEMAKELDFSSDADAWVISEPPALDMVRWSELRADNSTEMASELVGYACVFGLYAAFVPVCLSITNVANSIHMGVLQPLWASLAPTMGLTIFLSFLPTVLLLVIDNFYQLRSSSRAQEMLLQWYFWFQVIFVLLVTAVGNNFLAFCEDVAKSPFSVPHLLANQLPNATHFYMSYLVVQWSTHMINLLRYVNLAKFLGLRAIYPEEEAKKKAEPEDQDYYGFGSRSARWSINLLIGIVFGTLNPTIPLLALINFLICRVVYGYLIVVAETKKPDLGGNFWVMNLQL
ncbi:unnamed protein product, partial [Effrenium voratum]